MGERGGFRYEILTDAQHSSGHPKCQLDVYDDPVLSKLMLGTQSQPKLNRFTADFEKSLAAMPELPRLLHLSWVDKAVIDSQHPFVLNGIANLTASNPDWTLRMWDDDEMNGYIKEHVAPHDWALVYVIWFCESFPFGWCYDGEWFFPLLGDGPAVRWDCVSAVELKDVPIADSLPPPPPQPDPNPDGCAGFPLL